MRKENVYLISGRQSAGGGDPRGPVMNHVVCASRPEAVTLLATAELPGFVITSTVSLLALEETVKKVKAALKQEDTDWRVLVEPGL